MNVFGHLVQAVAGLVLIYMLALVLRKRGVLEEQNSMVLARVVTDLCLPAVVFVNLASSTVTVDQLGPAFLMLTAELSCIALAWGVSRVLGFSRSTTGAVVFCSAFGSSTFLGYALIMEMYPATPSAMTEAVLISEVGVGYPIFILGPLLAAYFGSAGDQAGAGSLRKNLGASFAFFRSPVFYALLLGLAWRPLNLPGAENAFLHPLFEVCTMLGHALTPLAILAVGLMFKVPSLGRILPALAVVVSIKLLLKPVALGLGAGALGWPELWRQVLVVLGAMPPAVLGAVFLRRYGGDAALASALLLVATLLSCLTLLSVFYCIA